MQLDAACVGTADLGGAFVKSSAGLQAAAQPCHAMHAWPLLQVHV